TTNRYPHSFPTRRSSDLTPHDNEDNVVTHTAQQAYEKVLEHAGASLKRDAVDLRIIDDVRNKTYTAHGSSGDQNSRFGIIDSPRSEEHTSELQSRENLVC